jgi:hypothetical protein
MPLPTPMPEPSTHLKNFHFGSEKDAATFGQININQNLSNLEEL